jgi:hypothetical protein
MTTTVNTLVTIMLYLRYLELVCLITESLYPLFSLFPKHFHHPKQKLCSPLLLSAQLLCSEIRSCSIGKRSVTDAVAPQLTLSTMTQELRGRVG